MTPNYNEKFFNSYCVCALWSTLDDNGEPLDSQYGIEDIDSDSLFIMKKDCNSFIEKSKDILEKIKEYGHHAGSCGHDFWLTRNGHGTGFWDREGIDKIFRDKLTKLSVDFKEQDLVVEENKIHVA